jgi:hypothetical protein
LLLLPLLLMGLLQAWLLHSVWLLLLLLLLWMGCAAWLLLL